MARARHAIGIAVALQLAACGGRTHEGPDHEPFRASDAGMDGAPDAGVDGAPDAGVDAATPEPCEAMDARDDGVACAISPGWTWDGRGCVELLCSCAGADCGALHPTESACATARAQCLDPSACEDFGDPRECENQPGCGVLWYGGGCVDLDTCSPGGPDGDNWICVERGYACVPTEDPCYERVRDMCDGECYWVEGGGQLCFEEAVVQPCCIEETFGYCAAIPRPDSCEAQVVTGCSDPCGGVVGAYWDGAQCQPIICCCEGADCGETYATSDECLAAHADCALDACALTGGFCAQGDAVEPTCPEGYGGALVDVGGACGMGKCCAVCPGQDDPDVSYAASDPATCAALVVACADGWSPWANECGCGCRRP